LEGRTRLNLVGVLVRQKSIFWKILRSSYVEWVRVRFLDRPASDFFHLLQHVSVQDCEIARLPPRSLLAVPVRVHDHCLGQFSVGQWDRQRSREKQIEDLQYKRTRLRLLHSVECEGGKTKLLLRTHMHCERSLLAGKLGQATPI
jgi:hypothetical protein